MSGGRWLVATADGRFRAREGERYPWTADLSAARRFASATKARAAIHDAARVAERSLRDYRLFCTTGVHLTPEPVLSSSRFVVARSAERYLIANEASDGETVTFRAYTEGGRGRWTRTLGSAFRWPWRNFARAQLAHLEAERARKGRRFVLAEIAAPDGTLAHRELTPDELGA